MENWNVVLVKMACAEIRKRNLSFFLGKKEEEERGESNVESSIEEKNSFSNYFK